MTSITHERHTVTTSQARLNLCRYYSDPEGTPIFMVHGLGGGPEDFYSEQSESGIASFLAAAGFDVFVAQLRNSSDIPTDRDINPQFGVHDLILEDLPAHLAAVAKIRPARAQYWIGHGLGAVLLASCYARLDILPSPVLGMVQFGAARHCELSSLRKSLTYMAWQACWSVGGLKSRRSSWLPGSGQSRKMLRDLDLWLQADQWADPVDDYDYRAALSRKGFPAALYFACAGNPLRGGIVDTRLWARELGNHDARIIALAKSFGNLGNYDYNSMLSSEDAYDDHFLLLLEWLREKDLRLPNLESRRA